MGRYPEDVFAYLALLIQISDNWGWEVGRAAENDHRTVSYFVLAEVLLMIKLPNGC